VSTARKEVDNIRTVKDKPHEDVSIMDSAQVIVYIFEFIIILVKVDDDDDDDDDKILDDNCYLFV